LTAGGVTQQKFEAIAPLDQYQRMFLAAQPVLVPTIAIDNLFIIAYVSALALGLGALIQPPTRLAGGLAIGGMVLVGLLDYAENLHFLTMYAALGAGAGFSVEDVSGQMWASLMKWHIAYFALFCASFVVRAEGVISFSLVWSLRVVLPVIGVAAATAPEAAQAGLLIARYGLMLAGFALFSLVFWTSATEATEPAA
jgi:hypothetical protein